MLNVPLLRAKAEPEPAAVAIPASELEAITGGGLAVLRELPGICEHAKKRLRQSDRPIVQADLDELLHMLAEAKERIDAEMAEIRRKPAQANDPPTEAIWDKAGWDRLIQPTIQAAESPQAIIDLTIRAATNGAKSAELLYKLVVAEMDFAVARSYVVLNTDLRQ